MRARIRTALRIATVALSMTAVMAVQAPEAHAVTRGEASVAWRINHEHYLRRLRSIAVRESLSMVARAHSCAMARSQRLYHSPNLRSQVRGWRVLGENVAVGYDLYQIHRAWMRSAGHRRNILDGSYRAVGVGICTDAGGALWVTTVFFG